MQILAYDKGSNRHTSGGKTYGPDDIVILGNAKKIFPRMLIDGREVDNIQRHLDTLPAGADGIIVWPYDPKEPVNEPLDNTMIRVTPYRFVKIRDRRS